METLVLHFTMIQSTNRTRYQTAFCAVAVRNETRDLKGSEAQHDESCGFM